MHANAYVPDDHLSDYYRSDSSRQRILRRRNALQKEFDRTWRPLLRDVGMYINPWRSRLFFTEPNLALVYDKMIDSYPLWAAGVVANGMMAGMTSPARPWFRLTVRDEALGRLPQVKTYVHELEDGVRRAFAQSNFYGSLHEVYTDLAGPGFAAMHLERDFKDPLRAYAWPVGSFFLSLSRRLEVDTIIRDTSLTVGQVLEQFGFDALSPAVQRKVRERRWDEWVRVVHAIQPNRLYEPNRVPQYDGPDGQAFRSCWLEYDCSDKSYDRLLDEKGFDRFPVMTPVFDRVGENIYGTGPGVYALPDSKALQEMWRRLNALYDKTTDPPMVGPTSLKRRAVSQIKGDWTFVEPGDQAAVRPMFEIPESYPKHAQEAIAQLRTSIDRHMRVDVFQSLIQLDRELGPRQMTAREVDERTRQTALQMGPMIERCQTTLFGPAVEWTIEELTPKNLFDYERRRRAGEYVLPLPPDELEGEDYEIEYISILAQAQKVATTASLHQVVEFTGVVAQTIDPKAALKLKTARMIETYADSVGVQPDLIEDDDAFQAKVDAIDQQAQEARGQQAALAGAETVQKLGQAQVGEGSALDALADETGGAA